MTTLTYQGINGHREELSYEPGGKCASAVLLLSERPGADNVWRVRVQARVNPGGLVDLGHVVTAARPLALYHRPGPRALLLAGCPGAVGWHASIQRIHGSRSGTFEWSGAPELGGLEGIEPTWGFVEREGYWTGGAHVTFGNTDDLDVAAGERVMAIHAWQAGDGALLTIEDDVYGGVWPDCTELPPDGSKTLTPNGHLWGPCTITLDATGMAAGEAGYTVELIR